MWCCDINLWFDKQQGRKSIQHEHADGRNCWGAGRSVHWTQSSKRHTTEFDYLGRLYWTGPDQVRFSLFWMFKIFTSSWLADNVVGLEDRKSCEKYCGQLLRQGFIEQNFKKNSFTAQCYYTLNEAKLQSLGHLHQNTMKRGVLTPIDINMPAMDDTQITKKKSGNMSKIRRLFCLSSNQRKKF